MFGLRQGGHTRSRRPNRDPAYPGALPGVREALQTFMAKRAEAQAEDEEGGRSAQEAV